ncbi:DUF1015 family protein [Pedobacter sp. P351]|uniref:DUF1015 domain-containing protein n=1 Tax=Pedobacter superstes TaxID=3133441 RepID=UPI0030A196A6
MPTIKAFKAIHPSAAYAGKVVSTIEDMSLETAKKIRNSNPCSFIHLLVPEIHSEVKNEEKKDLVFNQINENLKSFLRKGILVPEEGPSVYIYQLVRDSRSFTGIWTMTLIDDYAKGILKRHEHTRPEREVQLATYLEKTGIDANPVLVTYRSSPSINERISSAMELSPALEFQKDKEIHKLWKIDNPSELDELLQAFLSVDTAYIADGHHRVAAALNYGLKKRSEVTIWDGSEEFNYFSSVYMSDDQLIINSFDRLVKGLKDFTPDMFLEKLKQGFEVTGIQNYAKPDNNQIALYMNKCWYNLEIKAGLLSNSKFADTLAVSILHEHILKPLLDISDFESSERLSFISSNYPNAVIEERVDSGEFDLFFSINPITINDLFKVADSGEILPPKSTLFEPKFPVGLLIHHIDLFC